MKINNWSSYQSYKDRRPPWIRLHRTLVDNYEFQIMSANARALLPMLWLLACEDEDPTSGNIPYSAQKISFRLRISLKDVNSSIDEITKAGFLHTNQPCNETVTKPLQDSNQTVTPETETEKKEHCLFDQEKEFETIWAAYPNKDGKKSALRHFCSTVKSVDDLVKIKIALDNYLDHLKAETWKKAKNGSTWFNNWPDWFAWEGAKVVEVGELNHDDLDWRP